LPFAPFDGKRMSGERRTQDVEPHPLWFVVRRSAFVVVFPFVVLTSEFSVPNSQFSVASSAQQEPSFRSGSSELVVLPVVVTDKQGRYISNLPSGQFVVYDNGRRVPVELFTNEDTPVTVGLIIDASSSMRGKLGEVIAASLAFARSSNPQDELFAIRFNDDVQDLVPDRPFLLASDLGALEAAVTSVRGDGRTALYDGLMAGLDHLAKGTRTRKVLMVISDGGDNASAATQERVLARARESNAAIYTIGIFADDDMDKNPGVLKALARTTGGERFLPRSPGELLQACERIARDIRGGYTIGYVPPARDGAYHRVKVEIDPSAARRLNVRTRPGYFAAGGPTQP
jgi:Ca-activated chloride channel family protein